MNRLDEDGPAALLRVREPVNKFPDFVRYAVQRLQTLCPRLGKVKIAQMLASAGLHLGVTTIGRMRRQPPAPAPRPRVETMPSAKRVTAKYPNHVWHVDLTTVPTAAGFWASWLPMALPPCWPFCWWLAVVLDHYSRRALGFAVFKRQPTSEQMRQFLGRVIGRVGAAPPHLVTDHGVQLTAAPFKHWCRRRQIRQRFGAVGKRGSIAVIERFWRTFKDGCSRVLSVVPLLRRSFHREVSLFLSWYNDGPHMTLNGATPDEAYFARHPACRLPRFEPPPRWPRASPCARPPVLVKGQAGAELDFNVKFVPGRRHLPRLTVTRAA
jgi:transposase InsO family protein